MTLSTRLQNQNCCFWVKHTEGCAQIKHAGAAITAALTAITLAGCVLLILAHQGFDLAGINSIAQMVEPKWIYLGMGIAGAVAIINITFIIAQVRSYLNRTISDDELDKTKFSLELSNKYILEQLTPKSFALVIVSNQYIVISNNEEGDTSYLAFRNQEEADYNQSELQQKGYAELEDFQSSSAAYYPQSVIQTSMGLKQYHKWSEDYCESLGNGYYRSSAKSIALSDIPTVWPLAVHDDGGIGLRFFKTEGARSAAIQKDYSAFWNKEEIDQLAQKEYTNQVLMPLNRNEFWEFQAQLDEQVIYFVAYQIDQDIFIQHLSTETARSEFIKTELRDQEGNPAVNAKLKYFQSPTYSPQDLTYLTTPEAIHTAETIPVPPLQYERVDLPRQGHEKQRIYALKVAGDPPITYFKTDHLRQEHIGTNLKGFVNALLVRNKEQKAEADLIHHSLENPKDFWCLPIVDDIVCIYYRSDQDVEKHLLKVNELETFKVEKKLEHDVSGLLTKNLVEALVQRAGLQDTSELFPLDTVAYLSKREYAFWPPVKTTSTHFPLIYAVHAKKNTGAIECFYFATEQARNKMFLENKDFTDGYPRHLGHLIHASHIGSYIYLEQVENPMPILFTFFSPDQETTSFVTYNPTQADPNKKPFGIDCKIVPFDQADAQLQSMLDTHLYINKETLANRPLSIQEINDLNITIKTSKLWFDAKALQEKQFVACPIPGYIALFLRHENNNGAQTETLFFRNNASKYLEKLEELENDNYENVEVPS